MVIIAQNIKALINLAPQLELNTCGIGFYHETLTCEMHNSVLNWSIILYMSSNEHGMDLKDFIATTLISVREGIVDANKQTSNKFRIYGANKVINFDIVV